MAAPHVAAAAALALEKHGKTTASDMKELLMKSVDKTPEMKGMDFSKFYGSGRLNLLKL